MARTTKPAFVDVGNPAMAIECPNCGLLTARFGEYCSNCGFSLWPSGPFVSAAFKAWQSADPARSDARRFDLELAPAQAAPEVVDYEERAQRLGIHLFPSSSYPFVICVGFFFLALAAVPFASLVRIALGAVGALIFLIGVIGWVVLEDVRMFPSDDVMTHGAPGTGEQGRPHSEDDH
jgi:hypothetical protein